MLMPLSEAEKKKLKTPKTPSKNEEKKLNLQKKLNKKERRRNKKIKKIDFNSLDQVNFDAAGLDGLDIGADEIFVCVPKDRDEKNVRVFRTFTANDPYFSYFSRILSIFHG